MSKKGNNLFTGVSEPGKVDEFMATLNHPLRDVVSYVRKVILSVDKRIGEGIYWNAPTFYYTGKMKPFEPKEYKRYITGFVFNRPDCIRMVFLRGAGLRDESGILEGNYSDGRRLVVFNSLGDAKEKESALKKAIRELIGQME